MPCLNQVVHFVTVDLVEGSFKVPFVFLELPQPFKDELESARDNSRIRPSFFVSYFRLPDLAPFNLVKTPHASCLLTPLVPHMVLSALTHPPTRSSRGSEAPLS
jgi:hypothetical protein